MSELLETARAAAKSAQAAGAQHAAASVYRSREVEVAFRDGEVEKVVEATSRSLSLALYVDGRFSSVSTSDLRPEALRAFVGESVAMARTLAQDPHRALPDPKLYEGRSAVDLRVDDAGHAAVTPEDRRRLARALEEAARGAPGSAAIVSVSSSVSDARSETARVTTNGFEGESSGTSFSLHCSATVKDPDGRRPDGSGYGSSRWFADLPSPAEVGRQATTRAVGAIGAAKIPSGVRNVAVENRVASRLVRALLGPLGGRTLQQKQSYLDGAIGKTIASPRLTIVDEPLLPKGFGSRLWDGDGIAARRMPVVEAGVLRTYYIDVYYGRKLGLPPTSGSQGNLVVKPGTKGEAALLADMKDGILITGFLGGNSNSLTGDYSFGVQGFQIEKGQRTRPIAEMNLSGNQKDLWKKLAALGNDPYPYSSILVPTLVFDGLSVAGG